MTPYPIPDATSRRLATSSENPPLSSLTSHPLTVTGTVNERWERAGKWATARREDCCPAPSPHLYRPPPAPLHMHTHHVHTVSHAHSRRAFSPHIHTAYSHRTITHAHSHFTTTGVSQHLTHTGVPNGTGLLQMPRGGASALRASITSILHNNTTSVH